MNIQKQNKLSYVFISHDLEAIAKMADRVAVLYKGEIVESGSVEEVLSYPSHDYTKKINNFQFVDEPIKQTYRFVGGY